MSDPAQTPGTVALTSDGDITIGGDVVGRDKIVNTIQHFYERALTVAEAATRERALEYQLLAQGISDFVARLRVRASNTGEVARPYRGLLEYQLGDAELFFG